MMAYEYAVKVAALAGAGNYVDMAAVTQDAYVREIHVFATTAVAGNISLYRTTANGTRTTPVAPTAQTGSDLGTDANPPLATFATAWSVAPTLAAQRMRVFQNGAAIGSGVIWTWYSGPGLRVKAGQTIILNNDTAAASAALAVTFVWEE